MSDTSRIRLARPADAQWIAVMSRDLIEAGLRWRWTPRRVLRHVHDRDSNVIVAETGSGSTAGFALMQYADNDAHLLLFAVRPTWRCRGVGSSLLSWLELTVACADIELIFLEVRAGNAIGREFYRRRGYRELSRLPGYYFGCEDAIRVGKDLAVSPPCAGIRSD